MESYTKEQLINAMAKYYQEAEENPSKFSDEKADSKQMAVDCIEYLITLIK